MHNSFEQIIINFIKARKMKKIGLILTLLFTIFAPQEVLAATATQDLQVGHYYRIRSSVTTDMVGGVVQKHYMCLVYDNAASQYEVKILRQSDIVSAPGSIFKITGLTSSKINLETQEQDVWSSIKGSSLIDEHGRNWIWTADLLGINKPIKYAAAENSDGFHLSAAVRGLNSVGFATKAYFQDETLIYRNSNEDYHEPLGMSAEPSTIWYFEEVNEANIDDTYLGLPCAVSKESVTVSDMVTNTVDGVTYYYDGIHREVFDASTFTGKVDLAGYGRCYESENAHGETGAVGIPNKGENGGAQFLAVSVEMDGTIHSRWQGFYLTGDDYKLMTTAERERLTTEQKNQIDSTLIYEKGKEGQKKKEMAEASAEAEQDTETETEPTKQTTTEPPKEPEKVAGQ